jgi:purine-binding chemotaxis protein CheW
MSQDGRFLSATALELRRAFDRSFAVAQRVERGGFLNVLAIRIASEGYALRTADVAGLFKDRAVTPVPSAAPGLLGLAGVRGAVVPVYDLRSLLGQPRGAQPRWLVLAAGSEALGLAFDGFDGQFRVAREDVAGAGPDTAQDQDKVGAVRTGDVLRRIVDVPTLVERIKDGVAGQGPSKER